MKKNYKQENSGFALLFTVLIITLVLNIAIGISNTSFKQNILSTLAKDSQTAFYQADQAIECGLYYDIPSDSFPEGRFPYLEENEPIPTDYKNIVLRCGYTPDGSPQALKYDSSRSIKNRYYFIPTSSTKNKPSLELIFDKTVPTQKVIQGNGYSRYEYSPRQVERTLKITY